MGRLIPRSDFLPMVRDDMRSRYKLDPTWYFADAYWTQSRYEYTIGSSYPVALYVHNDLLSKNVYGDEEKAAAARRRVEIRRWIELVGDVIMDYVNLSYYRVYGPSQSVSTIDHGYKKFYFETDADAVAFRLQFDYVVSKTDPRHPRYGDQDPPITYDFDKRHEADDFVYKLKYCVTK
jgi:hypothetical protein